MHSFIQQLPKVELHMHIEGSMEPEMLWWLADKNDVSLPYQDIQALKAAYQFKDLTEFVNLYIQGTEVIQSAENFYTLTLAYLEKCKEQNIHHSEVFCDIRTYTDRGYPAEIVLEGIAAGFKKGKELWDITGGMIPCFIRHLGVDAAIQDWQILKQFKDDILGIGLAAIEVPYPPSMFTDLFNEIRETGLKVVAHAGEEGDADYIWSAINDLKVDRIDHGIRCLDDPKLVDYLLDHQIPLTVCPCSNTSLHVVEHLSEHPIKTMLDAGLNVTINSDDPAHFGAYLEENMVAVYEHAGITGNDLWQMSRNAVNASFADVFRKQQLDALLLSERFNLLSSV